MGRRIKGRIIIKVGNRVNKGHPGTTNHHFYIYKERIICCSFLGWQINSSRTHILTYTRFPCLLQITKHHPWLNNSLRKGSSHTNHSQGQENCPPVQFSYKGGEAVPSTRSHLLSQSQVIPSIGPPWTQHSQGLLHSPGPITERRKEERKRKKQAR